MVHLPERSMVHLPLPHQKRKTPDIRQRPEYRAFEIACVPRILAGARIQLSS